MAFYTMYFPAGGLKDYGVISTIDFMTLTQPGVGRFAANKVYGTGFLCVYRSGEFILQQIFSKMDNVRLFMNISADKGKTWDSSYCILNSFKK